MHFTDFFCLCNLRYGLSVTSYVLVRRSIVISEAFGLYMVLDYMYNNIQLNLEVFFIFYGFISRSK